MTVVTDSKEPRVIKSWKVKTAKRQKVGDRDGWICHICGLPIDRSLNWPHPLAQVADHYPIPVSNGGLATMENLRIAHSLCNGSTGYETGLPDSAPEDHREQFTRISDMMLLEWTRIHRNCKNVRTCYPKRPKTTCDYTNAKWKLISITGDASGVWVHLIGSAIDS